MYLSVFSIFFYFQVSSYPKHGQLLISQEKAILGQLFTQLDIDRGFVSYVHDHSDSVFDTFGVAIFLEGKPVSSRYIRWGFTTRGFFLLSTLPDLSFIDFVLLK